MIVLSPPTTPERRWTKPASLTLHFVSRCWLKLLSMMSLGSTAIRLSWWTPPPFASQQMVRNVPRRTRSPWSILSGRDDGERFAHLAHSTPTELLFTTTDFNSYVTVSTATGAPQRKNGRMPAWTAPA